MFKALKDHLDSVESVRRLKLALAKCQVILHQHVIHAGTDFEKECLNAIGAENTTTNVYDYRTLWQEIYDRLNEGVPNEKESDL